VSLCFYIYTYISTVPDDWSGQCWLATVFSIVADQWMPQTSSTSSSQVSIYNKEDSAKKARLLFYCYAYACRFNKTLYSQLFSKGFLIAKQFRMTIVKNVCFLQIFSLEAVTGGQIPRNNSLSSHKCLATTTT